MKLLNPLFEKLLKSLLLCLVVPQFLNSSDCNAQEAKTNSFILLMDLPAMSKIKAEQAEEISIAQNIWSADFGIELRFLKYAGVSTAIGLGSVKDYQPFSQNTTLGNLKSTFNITSIEVKGGVWFPSITPVETKDLEINLRANAGYEWMKGKREIDNCSNCTEEKFKFKPGFFVEPEIDFYMYQNIIGLGAAYRYYFSGSDTRYKIILLKLMLRIDY